MRITVNIDDDALKEQVTVMVTEMVVDDVYKQLKSRWDEGRNTYKYDKIISNAVKQVLKDDIENLRETAVDKAASYIEYKGVKRLIGKMVSE